MKKNNADKKLRYIAYVRKSSESKERQELSLASQIKNIKTQFGNLNIVKTMDAESKSAFTPGRPIFNEMMAMIDNGEADAIVAWHPNRLSRNEIDSSKITYLLRGKLKDLKFCSYTFDNSPEGIMMLQFVMNQGQYESSKQGREVKRGMITKAESGEKPGRVPLGYMKVAVLDEKGKPKIRPKDKKIVTETGIDPERYDTIKKMWKWFLYDRLTPSQVWKKVNKEEHFRNEVITYRDGHTGGGGPMTKSMVYRVFANPFYAGYYEHLGVKYKGNYEPMITWQEYQLAQELLGAKGNHRIGGFEYAFSRMIRCGECGCQVQARHNTRFIKKDNKYVTYVYYYCSRGSLHRPCNQTKYTQVELIECDIEKEIKKYTIIPEFKDLALKILKRNHRLEVNQRGRLYDRLQKQRNDLQARIDRLLDDLHAELLDEDEYRRKKSTLKAELEGIDSQLRNTEKRADDDMEFNEKAFNFAVHAHAQFKTGGVGTKRDILRTLGQSLILKDNKLYIEPNEWLAPIAEGYKEIEKNYLWFRTTKKADSKELEKALEPILELWRAQWDSNPRHSA